jgi:hypothetical protein
MALDILPAALSNTEAKRYVGGETVWTRMLELLGPQPGQSAEQTMLRPFYCTRPGKVGGKTIYRRETLDACLRHLELNQELVEDSSSPSSS